MSEMHTIRLVNATGDTMAELTPQGVRWVADSLPAELTITPEDRAVWLGLQLENARLQHEVERLQDELAALRLAQPVAAFLVDELPRFVDRLKEAPHDRP